MGGATVDYKARAVEQWTADPCGPRGARGISQLLAGRRDYARWMAEQLDYAGAKGLDVLDVGCGQGIDLCEFALAGARVTGIDLTPRHVELARRHLAAAGLQGEVVQGDAEGMPFEDESFDRVISNGVLHHTPDIAAALRDIRRVLRPGGQATIILYNRNSIYYWLTAFLWRGVKDRMLLRERGMAGILSTTVERGSAESRPLVRVYSRRQVPKLLKRAGFGHVTTWINPYEDRDSWLTRRLPFRLPLRAGWYVVAQAQ
jgi:ubiquinone/menaquinone biosynthesis C-methylase UbiE